MTMISNTNTVTLELEEYKVYLKDTYLKKEREDFLRAMEGYFKAKEDLKEELQEDNKRLIKAATYNLEKVIKFYESNWFVKLFLKHKAYNHDRKETTSLCW